MKVIQYLVLLPRNILIAPVLVWRVDLASLW